MSVRSAFRGILAVGFLLVSGSAFAASELNLTYEVGPGGPSLVTVLVTCIDQSGPEPVYTNECFASGEKPLSTVFRSGATVTALVPSTVVDVTPASSETKIYRIRFQASKVGTYYLYVLNRYPPLSDPDDYLTAETSVQRGLIVYPPRFPYPF